MPDLADAVASGAPAAVITDQIAALQTRSPIWTLQVNCLYHCRVVHAHHGLEDADMFPALRRSNPELSAVVDKLEADHRAISDLLDDVEASAGELDDSDADPARQRLVAALSRLEEDLLAHLAYRGGVHRRDDARLGAVALALGIVAARGLVPRPDDDRCRVTRSECHRC